MTHIRLDDLIEYSAARRIKKKVHRTALIDSDMVCYEPGQGTVEHHHPRQDEVFYVVEGRGTIASGDEAHEVGPTSTIFAAAGVKHRLQAAPDSRMVVVFFKCPARPPRE